METFSPYVRQFMDRMKKPDVDEIDSILPAIALQQRNSIRTSRSTVGTMTGLQEYWKFIFSRLATGHDPATGREVRPMSPADVCDKVYELPVNTEVIVAFAVKKPDGVTDETMRNDLLAQGYGRVWIHGRPVRLDDGNAADLAPGVAELDESRCILVIQDRVKVDGNQQGERRKRLLEAVETAMSLGGRVVWIVVGKKDKTWAEPIAYRGDWFPLMEPEPGLFSSNSPLGACPVCRGYGRLISIDYSRAINPELSLADGALHIFESGRVAECKRDMMRAIKRCGGIRTNVPWKDLSSREREWVMKGETDDWRHAWEVDKWYGLEGFFKALEAQTHKMMIRVWLSHFRVYSTCPSCHGDRLRPEALCFTVGGKTLPELHAMPMSNLLSWIDEHVMPTMAVEPGMKNAAEELRSRVAYLNEVGLGYLTANRLTRTLSGGEIERVSLTTCLGASLTETLFVLDEPTVGLHPRDTGKLIEAMRRLRQRGNTLVVVEHEEAVIRAADWLVDMGPGSGAAGGRLVYSGEPSGIERAEESITGAFLSRRRVIPLPLKRRKPRYWLTVRGAKRHNLLGLDVKIPLGVYACLTGVSGSGKSTLAYDVIYLNDCLRRHEAMEEQAAEVKCMSGWQHIAQVVMVDQSPLIRTPRSTPAVYVGIFEDMRALFAATETAQARGLNRGFFSFNQGDGRCPRCSGMGSEKVEMQFLSDIFVPCPLCHGSRYGQEALSITIRGKNIADVLALTVQEAREFYQSENSAAARRIVARLDLLLQTGLGHLTLGQPLNTLSGGENQRLKLVKILIDDEEWQRKVRRKAGENSAGQLGSLLILDEPGTGLHFADLEVLLKLFRRLTESGHSLLVIEHNMELVKAADYVIDLGPEGGELGGQIVAQGTPEQIVKAQQGSTWRYLKAAMEGLPPQEESLSPKTDVMGKDDIHEGVIALRGARHHNLHNIDLDIQRGKTTVLTGLSGSGKSTIAFDIFFAEGQRRFMDVMSPYARQFTEQMESPNIDRLTGLPPTVAIAQNLTRGGSKSTVGTVTEVWQFLRLLYTRLGTCYCPVCHVPIGRRSAREVTELVGRILHERGWIALAAPVVRGRKGHYNDLARWAAQKGYQNLWIDGRWVEINQFQPLDRYSNHDVDIVTGQLQVTEKSDYLQELTRLVDETLELGEGFLHVIAEKHPKQGSLSPLLLGVKLACPKCGLSFQEPEPSTFSFNSPRGWCPTCRGHGFVSRAKFREDRAESLAEAEWNYDLEVERTLNDLDENEEILTCPDCLGERLNAFARNVRLQGMTPGELLKLPAAEAGRLMKLWKWEGREAMIARDSMTEIVQRLEFLDRVGLGYLALNRSATTLSGGETQRIRLASQLGSHLRGILYVLDEPTIGLHPRDNDRLLGTLRELKQRGNTLLIVEHDEATMRQADRIVDLGPGAGVHGGRIVAQGSFEEIVDQPNSVTGRALHDRPKHPYRGIRRSLPSNRDRNAWLSLQGCCVHNLKNINVKIPVARLTMITGVSGAGKTSLIHDTVYWAAREALGDQVTRERRAGWKKATGFECFRTAYRVDQSPIGKTPRSTPATYVGFMDDIRTLFATTEEARRLGFDKGRFSFNTSRGACEACKGTGMRKLEMDFLPPCFVTCPSCGGKRYNEATLAVRYKGKTIADVMAMNFEEAATFFESQPRIGAPLQLLVDTGLGYLSLGQASNTLSGGESQRLKLVAELAKGLLVAKRATLKGRSLAKDLYLIEEPSIGLHPSDVRHLIDVLHRLVDQGHTVMVIEHNTEMIAEADYIIEMGPGPGEFGGQIVAAGTPEQIAKGDYPSSPYLVEELNKGTK